MRKIKPTTSEVCDECSRKFRLGEVVYFCIWDGATVCLDCRDSTPALKSAEKEERVCGVGQASEEAGRQE